MSWFNLASPSIRYLTRDTYFEWMDKLQGYATQMFIWVYVDPDGETDLESSRPSFPEILHSYYDSHLIGSVENKRFEFEKIFEEYRMDLQLFRRNEAVIADLRNKIFEALHPNYRRLIHGEMTCREVLRVIKSYLEPTRAEQEHQIEYAFAKAHIVPPIKEVDTWIMEWERIEIIAKRLKMTNLIEKLSYDFGFVSNSLLPLSQRTGWRSIWDPRFGGFKREFSTVLDIFRRIWLECKLDFLKDAQGKSANSPESELSRI
ncbi:hypothetical protein HI914_02868 [Erysiphe necator]|uniref:Uncharacterized protein n=1 Tax=Uncinula necator TaxID=52586 RepID=A0A0B1PH18_UNCNE|nr:hypothetical protein HI914_02868 [Erysiphe necator]KHJ35784.1 hypothetical protein EV44_g3177 [Erysiphe necator]